MRKAALLLVLVALGISVAVAAWADGPTPAETAVTWTPISHVHRSSRDVRIEFGYGVCGLPADPVSRILVSRRVHTVVITVLMRKPIIQPGEVCPALARLFKRTVSLHGRLGARSLTDGATGHVRVRRPRH